MNNYKKSMLLLLSTVSMSQFIINANAANWRVTPSIAVSETYTDNVDLDDSLSQSDIVTQVSPQILITGEGARLSASLLYDPKYFFYPGDDVDKHELRHSLNAFLKSELISETFFVDARANIAQRFLDRRQAISSEQSSRTENRGTIQTYQVSPYLVHAFGTWVTAQLKYDFRHIRQSANVEQTTIDTFFGNSTKNLGRFSLTSGLRFNRLNWELSAEYSNEDTEFSGFEDTTLLADFSYQLTNNVAVLGSAGYQKRNLEFASFANFDGFIWDAGIQLTPGPRTSLLFRYGNQYEGDTFSLNARYKITSKNDLVLSYRDSIQTFQSFAFDNNSDVNIDPSLDSGFISGDLTRRKNWNLSLRGDRGRTTYTASAFYSKYKSDNVALDEKRYGGAILIQRKLGQRLNFSTGFTYNLSRFLSENTDDKFWSASVSMNYQISKSLQGTIGYVHSDRDQTRFRRLNGGSNYVSLSIRATL